MLCRSPEWASARRVAQHRRRELALCEKQERSVRRRIDAAKARERERALGLAPGSGGGDSSSSHRRGSSVSALSLAAASRASSGGDLASGRDEDVNDDVDELRRELQALFRHKVKGVDGPRAVYETQNPETRRKNRSNGLQIGFLARRACRANKTVVSMFVFFPRVFFRSANDTPAASLL